MQTYHQNCISTVDPSTPVKDIFLSECFSPSFSQPASSVLPASTSLMAAKYNCRTTESPMNSTCRRGAEGIALLGVLTVGDDRQVIRELAGKADCKQPVKSACFFHFLPSGCQFLYVPGSSHFPLFKSAVQRYGSAQSSRVSSRPALTEKTYREMPIGENYRGLQQQGV
jgi:hypothetical protein